MLRARARQRKRGGRSHRFSTRSTSRISLLFFRTGAVLSVPSEKASHLWRDHSTTAARSDQRLLCADAYAGSDRCDQLLQNHHRWRKRLRAPDCQEMHAETSHSFTSVRRRKKKRCFLGVVLVCLLSVRNSRAKIYAILTRAV